MHSARIISAGLLAVSCIAVLFIVCLDLHDRAFSIALCVCGTATSVGVLLWSVPSIAYVYRVGFRDGAASSRNPMRIARYR